MKNKPSDEGRMVGDGLARFADTAEQAFRKQLGFVPLRCSSCAFRKGTYPNGRLATVGDAMKCSMERTPFYCHHGMNGNGEAHICAGWLMLAGSTPRAHEAPWPLSTDDHA